jgi:toxin ParE1/3/4
MAEVHYNELALLDLDGIQDFIIERSDSDTATRFIDDLSETFYLLADMPQIGRARNDLEKGIRMFVHRRYTILYREVEDGAIIVRVAPPYRDIKRMFEGEE